MSHPVPSAVQRSTMRALTIALAVFLMSGCAEEVELGGASGFPPGLPGTPVAADLGVPGDAASALVRLGEALFFDPALSGNGNIACATCHVTFLATAEGLPLSLGQGAEGLGPFRRRAEGAILPRHTQDLFERAGGRRFFWDGRVEALPGGVLRAPTPIPAGLVDPLALASILPLLDREEMRGQPGERGALGPNELGELDDGEPLAIWDAVVARLAAFPDYGALAAETLRPFDPALLGDALAAFITDRWEGRPTRRDVGDMSDAAQRGETLFFGRAGCDRCHGGPLLSDDGFHNIGVPPLGPGFEGAVDEGRLRVSGDPADRFAFKTPPLRNVRLTPPYMHNGAYATLEGAVRHHLDPSAAFAAYDASQLPPTLAATVRFDLREAVLGALDPALTSPVSLTDADIADLLAFLGRLDTLLELEKPPNVDTPPSVPSGLPVPRWPQAQPHPFR